ncbi:MAG: hypothetical protein LBB74_07825 [Chitinispirillales bacterium]|jgi:hypothetical protein|nr:hypothetical protein [Chitinispirillales bacterium]
MTGRESKLENDMFFVCSLIEHIGRGTKNRRVDVVRQLGEKEIERLVELADVFHCEPLENTAGDLTEKYGITVGAFDNAGECEYNLPTVFDIAKVYKRLAFSVAKTRGMPPAAALIAAYSSPISGKIDDYNSSMYFENPRYIYESYIAGEPLKE